MIRLARSNLLDEHGEALVLERLRERDGMRSFGIDGHRCHNQIGFLVYQLSHQPVPRATARGVRVLQAITFHCVTVSTWTAQKLTKSYEP